MVVALSWFIAIVLGVVGLIHLYWLAGGQAGLRIAVPYRVDRAEPLFVPRRFETGIVMLLFWLAAAMILLHAHKLHAPLPPWIPVAAGWTLAAVFLIRGIGEFRYLGIFKRYRGSDFARMDTLIYSPLCLLLGAAALAIMLAPG